MARLGLTDCVSISRKSGAVFVIQRNSLGRPYRQTDVSGKTLEQTYTVKGYPEALRDHYSRSGAYNRVRQMNARGQVTLERRGDSDTLAIRRSFDPQRGWLTDIQSGSGNALQNLGYLYNAIGRLEWREDRRIAHREDFTYDALNRLKTVQLRVNSGSTITTLDEGWPLIREKSDNLL